jgi:4-hydroxy-tetrahydrodipicolinate synthase
MPRTIQDANELQGVFPALFTPLKDDDPKRLNNSIDTKKAQMMLDDLIGIGISGVVPVGTTGQSATVSPAQHIDFIKFVIDYVDDRAPVIAGAGSNCTRESVETINKVQKSTGQVTFLCVTGYYNNPPQEGLVNHYETLVQETGARIIIYNVPSRTSSYLEPDTVIRLAENESIIGLKQAVDFKEPGRMREDTLKIVSEVDSQKFSVLSGEDDALSAILKLGGRGIITATGNIPEASAKFLEIIRAFREDRKDDADRIQEEVNPYVKACFCRKNPIPLGTLFNSPVYQPLIAVRETDGGQELHQKLMSFIEESAPSLKKYF